MKQKERKRTSLILWILAAGVSAPIVKHIAVQFGTSALSVYQYVFLFLAASVVLSAISVNIKRIRKRRKRRRIGKEILSKKEIKNGLSVDEFLENYFAGERKDFEGAYILTNMETERSYVGQSKAVLRRVNQHLLGHGCADVYHDMQNGEEFRIRLYTLKGSGFDTLNELERYMIDKTGSHIDGYNKTAGNK